MRALYPPVTFPSEEPHMKAYLFTTGSLFGLIAGVHAWRMVDERHLASDPWYVLLTLAAAALSVWAWRLLGRRGG